MARISEEKRAITEVIQDYFLGTYRGNPEMLKRAFYPDAHITGNFNGQICDWTLDEFIQRVTVTPTAAEKDERYDKEILLIDVAGSAAIAKARVVVGNYNFIDYITLLKINEKWIIRNKSFTTKE